MDNISSRIKKIRKELDLTQEEFGNKIGVKGNTVTGYERGTRKPSDSVINMICLIFQVDQTWLRTGELTGDSIFIPNDFSLDSLSKLYLDYDCNPLEQSFLNSYFKLEKRERDAFCEKLKKMFPALSKIIDADLDVWQEVPPIEPQNSSITKLAENDSTEEQTTEDLEAKYKKSRSDSVSKTTSSASSIIEEKGKKKNA